jgi:hypothetical protein
VVDEPARHDVAAGERHLERSERERGAQVLG